MSTQPRDVSGRLSRVEGEMRKHTGNLQLSLSLQEGGVCFDEFLSLRGRMSVSTMSL